MVTLIAILISLLGYGTEADFEHWTEPELQNEINLVEEHINDGGLGGDWEL